MIYIYIVFYHYASTYFKANDEYVKQESKPLSKFEMAKCLYDMGKFGIPIFTWVKKMGSGYLQRINKEHERRLLQAKDIINYPQFKT